MGTTEESVFGDFQNLNGLISRDGRKVPEEIVDTISIPSKNIRDANNNYVDEPARQSAYAATGRTVDT